MAVLPVQTETFTRFSESFDVPTLVIFRNGVFRFLLKRVNSVGTPWPAFKNTEDNEQASIDLIEHIKQLALAQTEQWSESQLFAASQAQTIFIQHKGYFDIELKQEEELLDEQFLQMVYSDATVFSSNDCTPEGLEALVNRLLAWMNE